MGRIRNSAGHPDGKEVVFNITGPGDIFSEIALSFGRPRTADAMLMMPTGLYQTRRADFVRLIQGEPVLTTHLITFLYSRFRMIPHALKDST